MKSLNLSQIQRVNWGKVYEWEILFDAAHPMPQPFSDFVPATTITEPHGNLKTTQIETALGSGEIPSGFSSETLTVNYLDDRMDTVLRYHEDWIFSMTNNGISTIQSSSRQIICNRYQTYDPTKNVKEPESGTRYYYNIYPTGNLTSELSSDIGIRTTSVTYAIVSKKREMI